MRKILLLFIYVFLTFSCLEQNSLEYKLVTMNEAKKQMKLAGYVNEMIFKNDRETMINNSETDLLKEILYSSINTYNSKRTDENKINIKDYKFFFIPVLDDNDNKWVSIYAYCSSNESDWWNLSDWFMVRDGGNCYFMTAINLSKRLEGWIIPNGEA